MEYEHASQTLLAGAASFEEAPNEPPALPPTRVNDGNGFTGNSSVTWNATGKLLEFCKP